MNTLIIPTLNPIKYVEAVKPVQPQYVSRHIDDHHFEDTILSFEQDVEYAQPWQRSDSIRQQVTSNYFPINLKVIDEYDNVVFESAFDKVSTDQNDPAFGIFQHDLDLSAFPEGLYWLKMECGLSSPFVLVSNALDLRDKHDNSVLFEFSHYRFRENVVFETGYLPSLRVHGLLRLETVGSKRTVYNDQTENTVLLDAKKFRTWKLHVSDSFGIPDYLIDKIESILGCSDVKIDGRYYTVADGEKFDENSEKEYPMRGWSISLREKLAKGARVYDGGNAAVTGRSVVIMVNSKGFGNDSVGGSEYQITDIN